MSTKKKAESTQTLSKVEFYKNQKEYTAGVASEAELGWEVSSVTKERKPFKNGACCLFGILYLIPYFFSPQQYTVVFKRVGGEDEEKKS